MMATAVTAFIGASPVSIHRHLQVGRFAQSSAEAEIRARWIPINTALPGAPIFSHWTEVARNLKKKVHNPPLADLDALVDKELPVNQAFEEWDNNVNRLSRAALRKRVKKAEFKLAEDRFQAFQTKSWNVTSVFDGPSGEQKYRIKEIDGERYRIFVHNMSWSVRSGARGEWNYHFDMPQFMFERDEKKLRQLWRKRVRMLRRKHGCDRYGNGRFVHLIKMMDNPFTRELTGYAEQPKWMNSPKELEHKEHRNRALKLIRRLEFEAEERRIARLHELGVFVGDIDSRSPTAPRVPRERPTASTVSRNVGIAQER